MMTELKTDGGGNAGKVRVADDVIAIIAGTAALEAEGVGGIAGVYSNDINNKAVRKHMTKGVNVAITGDSVALTLSINIKFGAKLQEVSREVQQRVKGAVETMAGLEVTEVNVSVGALVDDNKRKM